MNCWYCGGELCLDDNFDYSDFYYQDEGVVSFLHCTNCDAEVIYIKREQDEE